MHSKLVLSIGFFLILALLVVLPYLSISYTHLHTEKHDHIEMDNTRQVIVTSMLLITHRRTNLVYKMSFIQDPFARDDLYMEFRQIGGEFLELLDSIKSKTPYSYEKAAWEDLAPYLRKGGELRNTAINLILNGQEVEARRVIAEELLPIQDKVTRSIEDLLVLMQKNKEVDLLNTQSLALEHQNNMVTLSILVAVLVTIVAAIIIVYTIRNEKNLRAERERAQTANNHKSEFLANMSHEIRTPLTSILGYTDLIRNSTDLPEKFRPMLNTVHQSGNHLLGVIRDVLDLSKIESNKLTLKKAKTNVLQIVADTVEQVQGIARHKKIAIDFSKNFPFPKHVVTDPTRVRQIIYNLLGNAIKFSTPGTIHVDCTYNEKSETISFRVRDNGPGICKNCDAKPKTQTDYAKPVTVMEAQCRERGEHLLKPFTQVETGKMDQGSGLGLYISNELAKILGGGITCICSPEQRGAQFIFTFKAPDVEEYIECEDDFVATQFAQLASTEKLEGHVLIVEDIEDLADLAKCFLLNIGVSSSWAENGAEALDTIKTETFDAILMDKQMPVMDGIEATRLIRKAGIEIPIIALSADVMKDNIFLFKTAGATDFLSKPFSQQSLYAKLSQYLPSNSSSENSLYLDQDRTRKLQDLISQFANIINESVESLKVAVQNHQMETIKHLGAVISAQGKRFDHPELTRLGTEVEKCAEPQNIAKLLDLVEELEAQRQSIDKKLAANG